MTHSIPESIAAQVRSAFPADQDIRMQLAHQLAAAASEMESLASPVLRPLMNEEELAQARVKAGGLHALAMTLAEGRANEIYAPEDEPAQCGDAFTEQPCRHATRENCGHCPILDQQTEA